MKQLTIDDAETSITISNNVFTLTLDVLHAGDYGAAHIKWIDPERAERESNTYPMQIGESDIRWFLKQCAELHERLENATT